MKAILLSTFFSLLVVLSSEAQKLTLAVGPVEVNPTVEAKASEQGSLLQLGRIVESTDSELINSFQQTRRFDIFARSDLAPILAEQNLAQSGNLDLNDPNTAQAFRLAGVQYLVVTTVNDFQDYIERATFQAIGKTVTKRIIRIGAIAKIYDTTTGKLLESTRVNTDLQDIEDDPNYESAKNGDLSESLVSQLSKKLADQVANRVVDVLYPAKIVGVTGKVVMFNRGDGFGIAKGDIWKVYAEGDEMIDPDTGESLGSVEAEVGKIRVIDVMPKVTRAEIIEDYGIEQLQIVRPVTSDSNGN
ncbi:MAG: CsgG/HfaB family protein [Puniceicoccales bacterium]